MFQHRLYSHISNGKHLYNFLFFFRNISCTFGFPYPVVPVPAILNFCIVLHLAIKSSRCSFNICFIFIKIFNIEINFQTWNNYIQIRRFQMENSFSSWRNQNLKNIYTNNNNNISCIAKRIVLNKAIVSYLVRFQKKMLFLSNFFFFFFLFLLRSNLLVSQANGYETNQCNPLEWKARQVHKELVREKRAKYYANSENADKKCR